MMGRGSLGMVSLANQLPPVCKYKPQVHSEPESHPGALSGHLEGDAGAGLKEMNLTEDPPALGRRSRRRASLPPSPHLSAYPTQPPQLLPPQQLPNRRLAVTSCHYPPWIWTLVHYYLAIIWSRNAVKSAPLKR